MTSVAKEILGSLHNAKDKKTFSHAQEYTQLLNNTCVLMWLIK